MARGKKAHDKRRTIAERDMRRELERESKVSGAHQALEHPFTSAVPSGRMDCPIGSWGCQVSTGPVNRESRPRRPQAS